MSILNSFISPTNPNPKFNVSANRASMALYHSPRHLHQTAPAASPEVLGIRFLAFERRRSSLLRSRLILSFAASPHEESKHSDIEVEKGKKELEIETEESQEAWNQTLDSFKEQAIKMQGMSQEAYELYSKKAMLILKESSVQLKIQAEKARQDLGIVAKEISEESNKYLSTAAKNSPESVRDIVDTFASSTDEMKDASKIRDFYLGIPYGAFLSIGGFLSFMLTGSISAIRFGVVLGGALLALSVLSLRSWKNGESSALFLKGQVAIAVILFIREMCLLSQRPSLPASLMTLISGTMVIFYLYRIMVNGQKKGPSLENGPESSK